MPAISKSKILFLAFGHGLNDCIAGFFLGSLALMKIDPMQIGIGVTAYNLLAFGGQYPVAILFEKKIFPKNFLVVACGLNIAAVIVFFFSPQLAIILAGVASAFYHVAGGTVCATGKKAFHIGLFAAPGVAGLIAGGLLAWNQINIINILFILTVLFFLIISRLKFDLPETKGKEINNGIEKILLDRHDMIMILLLLIVSLRSAVWNIFQLVYDNNLEWLIATGVAACIGKIAGGWLADKIGWKLYAFSSILLATPLLTFFRKEMFLFSLGIGLLQSGIPATTALMIQSLKWKTARGISLSFGLSIILGALVGFFPLNYLLKQMPFILVLSFLLLAFYNFWGNKEKSLPI